MNIREGNCTHTSSLKMVAIARPIWRILGCSRCGPHRTHTKRVGTDTSVKRVRHSGPDRRTKTHSGGGCT